MVWKILYVSTEKVSLMVRVLGASQIIFFLVKLTCTIEKKKMDCELEPRVVIFMKFVPLYQYQLTSVKNKKMGGVDMSILYSISNHCTPKSFFASVLSNL